MTDLKDLHAMRHDVNSLRQEFKSHQIITQDEIKDINKKIDRLIMLIEGDPIDINSGMFRRLMAVESFVSSMKRTKAYLSGNIAFGVFAITALGAIIGMGIKIYELFFKK